MTQRQRIFIMLFLAGLAVGCGSPRTQVLTQTGQPVVAHPDQVDVYVGLLQEPHRRIAIIESEAYARLTDEVKREQIEQLRRKARSIGANAVQELRMLSKYRHGFVIDERAPVRAWRQGSERLYFMRGVAVFAEGLETTGDESPIPEKGWVIDRLSPPRPLETGELDDLRSDRLAETDPGTTTPQP